MEMIKIIEIIKKIEILKNDLKYEKRKNDKNI